jgi:hypothetical protein
VLLRAVAPEWEKFPNVEGRLLHRGIESKTLLINKLLVVFQFGTQREYRNGIGYVTNVLEEVTEVILQLEA